MASSCTTYHYDIARLGCGDGAPAGAPWHRFLSVNLGAAVRGAALHLRARHFRHGPHAGKRHDVLYVASSDNHVYAFLEHELHAGSTTALWCAFLGNPVTRSGSNIPPPLGVCSTPVLDPDNDRMFVLSYQDIAGTGTYLMFSLDLDTGATIHQVRLHDPGAAGRPTFDGNTVDQRGALNLVDGQIVATFADFLGYDAGPYHGWVVSCYASNLHHQLYLSVTTNVLGGGCWGPGGAAAADGSLYVGTGNATTADAAYWAALPPGTHPGDRGDFFEAVVRIGLSHHKLEVLDWYQPTNAKEQNDADLDFGSSSPLVVPEIDGRKLVVISAKFGIYLLDRDNMGHWGGELWKLEGNIGTGKGFFPEESHSAPAYMRTPAGEHMLYFVGGGMPGLIAFKVVTGPPVALQEVWRATGGGINCGNTHGSPAIGRFHAHPFALVWIVDCDEAVPTALLRAFNAMDGSEVFNSGVTPSDDLGPVPHYPPITCAGTSVYVGTADGFACYGAQ
jgi:hypothetical protein